MSKHLWLVLVFINFFNFSHAEALCDSDEDLEYSCPLADGTGVINACFNQGDQKLSIKIGSSMNLKTFKGRYRGDLSGYRFVDISETPEYIPLKFDVGDDHYGYLFDIKGNSGVYITDSLRREISRYSCADFSATPFSYKVRKKIKHVEPNKYEKW